MKKTSYYWDSNNESTVLNWMSACASFNAIFLAILCACMRVRVCVCGRTLRTVIRYTNQVLYLFIWYCKRWRTINNMCIVQIVRQVRVTTHHTQYDAKLNIYINPNGRIIWMTIEHTKCMWIESNKIIEYSISMQQYSFIFSLAAQVAQNLWAMEKRWVCMTMIPQTTTITNGLCGFTRFFFRCCCWFFVIISLYVCILCRIHFPFPSSAPTYLSLALYSCVQINTHVWINIYINTVIWRNIEYKNSAMAAKQRQWQCVYTRS